LMMGLVANFGKLGVYVVVLLLCCCCCCIRADFRYTREAK
jgi:hypothetical protein